VTRFGVRDLSEFSTRLAELRRTLPPPISNGDFVAYTDGACFGNPEGVGGWAAVVLDESNWRLFGHLSSTSNNRAEALGVLAALEWVPTGSKLSLHSDSELTVRLLQGRYKIKSNTDIWDQIIKTRADKRLDLSYEWVRGHAGDPLNELADQLSKLGARDGSLDDLDALSDLEVAAPPKELVGLEPRTDWEREFLTSVADQLRRGRALSEKQQAVIDRIRGRARKG
jgi:ribonuclease HI